MMIIGCALMVSNAAFAVHWIRRGKLVFALMSGTAAVILLAAIVSVTP